MPNIFSIGLLGCLWQGVKLCHFQCKPWVAITTVVLPYNCDILILSRNLILPSRDLSWSINSSMISFHLTRLYLSISWGSTGGGALCGIGFPSLVGPPPRGTHAKIRKIMANFVPTNESKQVHITQVEIENYSKRMFSHLARSSTK